jgi:hypothetical protein
VSTQTTLLSVWLNIKRILILRIVLANEQITVFIWQWYRLPVPCYDLVSQLQFRLWSLV